jgi:PKD repeat protein
MYKIKSLIAILAFISSTSLTFSQECGTVAVDYPTNFNFSKSSNSNKISDGLIRIPIKIHIINKSDGTGGISLNSIVNGINQTNVWYADANMEFFILDDVNFINDDDFFDLKRSQEGAIAVPNDVPKVINMYFSNSLTASGINLCGYSSFPGGTDRVFMANGCTSNGNTLAHELGHYFGLYHPHEVAFGAELVDGSNCTKAGDKLCSTPADPNLSDKVNSSNCSYTGNGKDANGDFYVPMIENIMSYSPDNCQDTFTQEQYEKMRGILEIDRSYLNLEYSSFAIIFSANKNEGCFPLQVKFKDESIGASERVWTFPGGTPSTSTAKEPSIIYNTPGIYNVQLDIKNLDNETLNTSKDDFIKIIDPADNLISTSINRSFQSEQVENNNWRVINQDPTNFFKISGNGFDDDHALVIENFNNSNIGEVEYFITPKIDFTDLGFIDINFKLAYSGFESIDTIKFDKLELVARESCSNDWIVIKEYTNESILTSPKRPDAFVPSSQDWLDFKETYSRINVDVFTSIELAFRVTNGNANNLYLDNISIEPDYEISAPELLEITQNNSGKNIIRWVDNSNNENSFNVERSINGSSFEVINVANKNGTTYLDTDNNQSGEYLYRVRANGVNNNSPFSNTSKVNLITSLDGFSNNEVTKPTIYPNPTGEVLTISGSDDFSSYKINTIWGSEVMSGEIKLAKENSLTLNIATLSEGVYLLTLKTKNSKSTTFRFVKQ